jgi:hypothetical protein
LLNYLFLASHAIHHKLVTLSLSGLADPAAWARVGWSDLREARARFGILPAVLLSPSHVA